MEADIRGATAEEMGGVLGFIEIDGRVRKLRLVLRFMNTVTVSPIPGVRHTSRKRAVERESVQRLVGWMTGRSPQ